MRSDVGMAMQIVHLLIVFTSLLQKCCSAKELLCTVKESKGLPRYTVPKYNATGCVCYWTDPNGNNLKIDNPENEMKGQSEWTFPLEICYNQLNFSCTCISEGQRNTASCTTDCSKKKKGVSDQQEMKNDPTESANDNATPRHHWMLMGSGILFVLLLLAFCYKGALLRAGATTLPV